MYIVFTIIIGIKDVLTLSLITCNPLEYADFEGEIPQGQYGAGTVTIWDRGGLVVEDLRENEKILFELSGNKMQGRYALIKTKIGGGKKNRNWLFFKRK